MKVLKNLLNHANSKNHKLDKIKQVEPNLFLCNCKQKGCKSSFLINTLTSIKITGSGLTMECRNRRQDITPEYDLHISTKAIKGIKHGHDN